MWIISDWIQYFRRSWTKVLTKNLKCIHTKLNSHRIIIIALNLAHLWSVLSFTPKLWPMTCPQLLGIKHPCFAHSFEIPLIDIQKWHLCYYHVPSNNTNTCCTKLVNPRIDILLVSMFSFFSHNTVGKLWILYLSAGLCAANRIVRYRLITNYLQINV